MKGLGVTRVGHDEEEGEAEEEGIDGVLSACW